MPDSVSGTATSRAKQPDPYRNTIVETKKLGPDRSKIDMHDPQKVKYWIKHLNTSMEDLEKAITKVGNSAAAVRKELGVSNDRNPT